MNTTVNPRKKFKKLSPSIKQMIDAPSKKTRIDAYVAKPPLIATIPGEINPNWVKIGEAPDTKTALRTFLDHPIFAIGTVLIFHAPEYRCVLRTFSIDSEGVII